MFLILGLWLACDSGSAPSAKPPTLPAPPAAPVTTPTPAAAGPRVVFLGDSLTAGLGVAADDAYPAVVAKELAAAGHPITLVNAGVSGDTTAGGLRRADWVLGQKPAVLVLALGANDMLRGLPVAETKQNLAGILDKAKAAGVKVVLLGMRSDPSLGAAYNAEFDAIYKDLADTYGVALVPFMLDGVAGVAALNQADGIHPTPDGHKRIAALVVPALTMVVRAP